MHWEIDIDRETLELYKGVDGPFGKRLCAGITETEEGASFILDEKERCPFLNQQNLCDIILELGEGWLCDICTEHPRYYNWVSDGEFAGVGLACEAAAELILDPEVSDALLAEQIEERIAEEDPGMEDADSRAKLEYENALNGAEEMRNILDVMAEVFQQTETCVSHVMSYQDVETSQKLIEELLTYEINSPVWPERLHGLQSHLRDAVGYDLAERDQEYAVELKTCTAQDLTDEEILHAQFARLIRYFIYRHFFDACEEDVIRYAKVCVYVIRLLFAEHLFIHGQLSMWDRIEICKLFSQEIEYDDENTEKLINWAAEHFQEGNE